MAPEGGAANPGVGVGETIGAGNGDDGGRVAGGNAVAGGGSSITGGDVAGAAAGAPGNTRLASRNCWARSSKVSVGTVIVGTIWNINERSSRISCGQRFSLKKSMPGHSYQGCGIG